MMNGSMASLMLLQHKPLSDLSAHHVREAGHALEEISESER